jgi:hypothetical protein
MEDYEKLLRHETDLDNPNGVVVSYCSNALSQYDKYNIDVRVPTLTQLRQEAKRLKGNDRRRVMTSVSKLAAAIVITLLLTAFTANGIAVAMGYDNVLDLIRSAFSSS